MKRKYLYKLRLYRFQSYADEYFKFGNKTNALVGETDTGKSAITRALYWIFYNRPIRLGVDNEFASYNEPHVFASAFLSDGTIITRGRRNDENYYILDYVDEKGEKKRKTFKGFGFEVPQEIMDAHGMPRLEIDDTEQISLNISQQLDPIFMFDDAASKKSKVLGHLSGANKVDGGIDILNGWQRKSLAKKKELLDKIKKLSKEIEGYNFIENAEKCLEQLAFTVGKIQASSAMRDAIGEKVLALYDLELSKEILLSILLHEPSLFQLDIIIDKLESSIKERDSLDRLFNDYNSLNKESEKLQSILNCQPYLDKVSKLENDLGNLLNLRDDVQSVLNNYNSLVHELERAQKITSDEDTLNRLNNILLILDENISLRDSIISLINKLNTMVKYIERYTEDLLEAEGELHEAHTMYVNYMESLNMCPLCEQKIEHGGC